MSTIPRKEPRDVSASGRQGQDRALLRTAGQRDLTTSSCCVATGESVDLLDLARNDDRKAATGDGLRYVCQSAQGHTASCLLLRDTSNRRCRIIQRTEDRLTYSVRADPKAWRHVDGGQTSEAELDLAATFSGRR